MALAPILVSRRRAGKLALMGTCTGKVSRCGPQELDQPRGLIALGYEPLEAFGPAMASRRPDRDSPNRDRSGRLHIHPLERNFAFTKDVR